MLIKDAYLRIYLNCTKPDSLEWSQGLCISISSLRVSYLYWSREGPACFIRIPGPDPEFLIQEVGGEDQKLEFLWSSWILLMLLVQKSHFVNSRALRSLFVEIKTLTKAPKSLSVSLCGTIPHSPTLCIFSAAHPSGDNPHPLQVVLIHTTVSSLSPQLLPHHPQPSLLEDTDSCLFEGIVDCVWGRC